MRLDPEPEFDSSDNRLAEKASLSAIEALRPAYWISSSADDFYDCVVSVIIAGICQPTVTATAISFSCALCGVVLKLKKK